MEFCRKIAERSPCQAEGFRAARERGSAALEGERVRMTSRTASYWEFRAVRSRRIVQVYGDGEVWQVVRR